MKKIDKTKENIGVSSLDDYTRKKLFNEFVEAGGEIIDEKEERQLKEFDRDLKLRYSYKLEAEKSNNKYTESPKKTTAKYTSEKKEKNKSESQQYNVNEISKFRLLTQRFTIRLRLFFMSVTDFSGYYFSYNFLKKFEEEYNSCLLSMQTTYFNIFKQNLRNGQRIIESLDKIHPVYFELIELLSNIFDRTTSNQILEHYYNFPDVQQETKEIREPLTRIFRKLHPLYLNKDLILNGLERALTIQSRLEKIKFTNFHSKKRKIKNNIYIIFNKLYPRLFWLMCNYEKRIFLSNRDLEDTITIFAEDCPGRRKKNAPKTLDMSVIENASLNDMQSAETKGELKETIPDQVKKGLEIMCKIDLKKNSEIYRRNRIYNTINLKDKVFITNVLFNEFDNEFSFLLTTKKIKYNTIYKSTDNLDYKNKFINIYNEMGKCKTGFIDYANALAAFNKLKLEKPISSTQFIEYSNRLTALNKEKEHIGSNARNNVKVFMERLCKELKHIIEDMNIARSIIINPEDLITFETEIEGDKILNNKDISEAIIFMYNYAEAFIYRLGIDGDLSGSTEFGEGEQNIIDSDIFKENPQSDKRPVIEERLLKEKESQKKISVLNELDDLL